MDFGKNITIRRLFEDERPAALDLAWRVFSEYESPDYSAEGTEEFQKCLHDEEYLHGLQYYGAFDGDKLIGEIAIRPDRKPLSRYKSEKKKGGTSKKPFSCSSAMEKRPCASGRTKGCLQGYGNFRIVRAGAMKHLL